MNSKRRLFPDLFREFELHTSVNTQGSVKVAQAVPQHLSQDWERDSQLTKVDHAYSLLYKSRYVYNTSVPHHVVRIARALALKLPVSTYFGTLGRCLAYLPFRVRVPTASHPRRTPSILSLPHPHTLSHTLFLSLTHTPFAHYFPLSSHCIAYGLPPLVLALQTAPRIIVDPPRVPVPCAIFVSMHRYSSSTHSTPISPLSFEAVKPLHPRRSLGHVTPFSLRALSFAISASVLLLSYLHIPRHSSRHLVPYGLGSLS